LIVTIISFKLGQCGERLIVSWLGWNTTHMRAGTGASRVRTSVGEGSISQNLRPVARGSVQRAFLWAHLVHNSFSDNIAWKQTCRPVNHVAISVLRTLLKEPAVTRAHGSDKLAAFSKWSYESF